MKDLQQSLCPSITSAVSYVSREFTAVFFRNSCQIEPLVLSVVDSIGCVLGAENIDEIVDDEEELEWEEVWIFLASAVYQSPV